MKLTRITFLLFLCLLGITTQSVYGVPAVPWPVEKIQPDGTRITVHLRGDEQVHWMESLEGYTLMYDAQKYIVYAEQDAAKNLVPSKIKFGEKPSQSLKKGLRYSPSQVAQLKQIWKVTEDGTQQKAFLGPKKALCVLVGFSNQPFTKSVNEFENLMNQVGYTAGGAKGSVKDFYLENSYGQLELTVTVVGTYEAPNTTAYYANGHERDFALFALNAADPDVDYNDFAVDGKLETFHIIFAGYGDENIDNGQQIWSHKWQLASPVTRDGVQISVYSCSPELRGSSGTNITYIGVVAHELGHVFGSPDYYDTTYSGFPGTGNWDIMAGGSWNDSGRQPAHVNPLQKIIYGWITPTDLTDETQISNMPASAQEPVVYTIQAHANGEEYILENKQKVGFDTSLPGHGLVVWHVHQLARGGNGSNSGHPQQLYPVYAAATTAIPTSAGTYGAVNSQGTPFPGSSGKTAFTDSSIPQAFTWTGLTGIGKPVTEIAESDNKISFGFLKGIVKDPVTDLQSAVDGGKVTLTWTAPDNDVVLGYKVYRNDVLQYTISGKANTSYVALNVPNGSYTYSVSVKYEFTESTKETTLVSVTGGSDAVCLPVSNLKATPGVTKVNLSWKAPFTGGWVGIAGNPNKEYLFGEEWDFYAGTLWSPADLVGLEGYKISKIKFVPLESAGTYSVVIYQVEDGSEPEVIYTQPITGSLNYGGDYNEISLTTPVEYDPAKGLIVGVQIHTLGESCLSVSTGDAYPGRNIFYDVDGWMALEDIGVGLGENFSLQAYLDGASGAPEVILDANKKAPVAHTSFLQKGKSHKQLKASPSKISKSIEKAPATITQYLIYRDGVQLDETTSTFYVDETATQETTYSYCVSVVYDNTCTSETVCVETTTSKPINPNKPVENLKAKGGLNDVELTWDTPYSGGIIGYSGATIGNAYAGSIDFSMAARFTREDVVKMAGLQLTEVTFGTYPTEAGNVNPSTVAYTIRVWTGGDANGPDALVYEQPVPTYALGWNTIPLTTPVDISGTEELWIGLHAVKLGGINTGIYPATVDAGPAVVGKGDMIYIDGTWASWTEYTGSANVNWTILGKLEAGNGSSAPVILSAIPYKTAVNAKSVSSFEKVSAEGLKNVAAATNPQLAAAAPVAYKVYRDGSSTEIAEVTGTTYTDHTVDMMTEYEYCVKAVHGTTDVSEGATIFSQDFETSTAGWVVRDADGDGKTWDIYSSASIAHGETNFALSYSWYDAALHPDNWLISPAIPLTSDNALFLEYFISALDADWPAEHYGVYISTTTTAASEFTLLSEETMAAVSGNGNNVKGNRSLINFENPGPQYAQGSWKKRTIDLSAYAGQTVYIAFRHFNCSDEYALVLDDIRIYEATTTITITGESDPVCVSVTTNNPYKPVETLDVKVIASDVSLKWKTAPVGESSVVFEEGFEGGIPTTWTNKDVDNDGFLWEEYTQGTPHSGTTYASSESYYNDTYTPLTPDNWLITPSITLTNDNTLEYYIGAQDADYPAEHYGVYISTTGTNTSDFTLLSEETLSAVSGQKVSADKVTKGSFRSSNAPEYAQGAWRKKTIDLSAYAGQSVYIAFRHFDCTDWFRINLDDVKITTPAQADPAFPPVFNVYDGDTKIADKISANSLELNNVTLGSHTYCVEAFYDNGGILTDSKCKTVSVVALGDPHRPVSNLTATSVEHDGTLTWETPKYAEKLRYHTYESGAHGTIGTGSAADFDIAARFTPKDLQSITGLLLTKVKFIPVYDQETTAYSIRVWQGGSWGSTRDEGSLIVDQAVTSPVIGSWNEIALDSPVAIDPTQELWIGVRCNTTTGHPASMQMPGAIEGKGNLMFFQGSWATATELGSSLNGNWIIDGIAAYHQGLDAAPIQLSALKDTENRVSTGVLSATEAQGVIEPIENAPPVLPEVAKYVISRENTVIGETTGLSYNDQVDVSGTYTYSVKAIYDDAVVADPVEVNITYISECDNAPENVTAKRVANEVKLAWDYTHVVMPGESNIDVLFSEDFTNGLPATWKTIDADGDTEGWYVDGDATDGYMSSDSFSANGALTPDNWLITPPIDLNAGSSLSYNVSSFSWWPEEYYGVFISTTNTHPASFTSLFEEMLQSPAGAPVVNPIQKTKGMERPQYIPAGSQARTIDLSAYAGQTVYLAFRHFNCEDQLYMTIDDVKVEAPKAPKTGKFNVYKNDEPIAENVDGKEYTVTLTESGRYALGISFIGQIGCESAITYSDSIDFKVISFTAAVADKVYDGNTTVVVNTITFAGLDSDDEFVSDVDYTVESAEFVDVNAGTNKDVTVTIGFDNLASEYYLAEKTVIFTADITPKSLVVRGLKAANKIYDATTDVAISGFLLLNGKVNGDDVILSGDLKFAFEDANVADSVAVTIHGLELDGEHASNYLLELPELKANITPAAILLKAYNGQKVYGDEDPELTYAFLLGQLFGNDSFTGALSRSEGENAGSYAIEAGDLTAGENYSLTFMPGASLAITPATITVTPDADQSKVYGDEDIVLSYTTGGWKFDDTADLLTGALSREAGEAVGSYKILQGTLTVNNNYRIDFVPDVLFEILTNTGIGNISVPSLQIYPNPVARGEVFNVVTDITDGSVQVFTLTGTLIKQQEITGTTTQVSLAVPSGIYILNVGGKRTKIEVY